MFYSFLLVVLVLDALVLVASILLQAGKGGGLSANFGGASSSPDAFVGIRQAGTILTKATWWCGGIFLALAFALQLMSTRTRTPRSVLEETFATPPAGSAPSPSTAAPIVPLQPVPGTQTPTPPATTPPPTTTPQR